MRRYNEGGQSGKNNALYRASASNSLTHVVERLIAGGAEVDSTHTVTSGTPLLNAAYHGSAYVVERLIAAGANVDKACRTDDGSATTPLCTAAKAGHGRACLTDIVRHDIDPGLEPSCLELECIL